MALPSSGPMKASMIRAELKESGSWSINSPSSRKLAKVPSGVIKFSDFYGKSNELSFNHKWIGGNGVAPRRKLFHIETNNNDFNAIIGPMHVCFWSSGSLDYIHGHNILKFRNGTNPFKSNPFLLEIPQYGLSYEYIFSRYYEDKCIYVIDGTTEDDVLRDFTELTDAISEIGANEKTVDIVLTEIK